MEILALIDNSFPTGAVRRIASFLGEEESKIRRGLQETIPSVLAALINSTSDEDCISSDGEVFLKRLLMRGSHDGQMLGELANILSNPRSTQAILSLGERAVEAIFGAATEPVRKTVAEDCGMSIDSTSHLLSLTALVMLEVLAREAAVSHLEPEVLLSQVHAQRRHVARALPAEVARYVDFYEQPKLEERIARQHMETPVRRFTLRVMRLLA